ncbi:MAG: thiamine phosphate synthase [Chloroflexi bacterium]|nr:thiamine phosphate synthase [Chloroflexota bacterium]
MQESILYRMADANINRTVEGLRVLEDVCRFILNNTRLVSVIKEWRQKIAVLPMATTKRLLWQRNSLQDSGKEIVPIKEASLRDSASIVVANSRRVQESLRVLEEIAKDLTMELDSNTYREARYVLYDIEKDILGRLLRKQYQSTAGRLYVIVDTSVLPTNQILTATAAILRSGVKMIQLRDKKMMHGQLLELAVKMCQLCKEYDALFIVNDYADIAVLSQAHGLHLGQQDLPASQARKILPADAILGISIDTAEQAVQAEREGADYIAVGAIFGTSTKAIDILGIARLKEVLIATTLPVWGIGGIKTCNACEVIAAGACGVCVVTAVIDQPNIEQAATNFLQVISNCQ